MSFNTEENMRIFRERLRELRGDMTQHDFAKVIGMPRGAVSYYENGERTPDIETLLKIADYCKVPCGYLLGESQYECVNEIEEVFSDYLEKMQQLIDETERTAEEYRKELINDIRTAKERNKKEIAGHQPKSIS